MTTTLQRIDALTAEAGTLAPWTGAYDREALREWLRLELGHPDALDAWVPHGPSALARAVPLSPVLHIVSGNTPHAAFQSVMRGLLAGCMNRVKIPSAGLPAFEAWISGLRGPLAEMVEISPELPSSWVQECGAAVIFGGADTIARFRTLLPAHVRRIEHGPKLSIAVVLEPGREAADRLAADILLHDQRGCLSVQAVYVAGGPAAVSAFGRELATALASYRQYHGRGAFSLSDSGAVSHAREMIRFRKANGEPLEMWESSGSTAWTVVCDPDPRLAPGPLNGFVRLHPLPHPLDASTLGEESAFLSTVALHPLTEKTAALLDGLSPPRLCPAGSAQQPGIFWHHDGMPALASLVRWRNLG